MVNSTFIIACETGNLQLVRSMLYYQNCNIHERTDYALRIASRMNHRDIVKILLENNANFNIFKNHTLRYACKYGNIDIVELLIKKGANLHAYNNKPLINAFNNNHLAVVKLLTCNGVDINGNHNYCVMTALYNQNIKQLKFLINNGANINKIIFLEYACEHNYISIVKLLLENGAYPHKRNSRIQYSILKNAAINDFQEITKLLLDYNADRFSISEIYDKVSPIILDILENYHRVSIVKKVQSCLI
jgi:ankyrin repeat protein